MHDLDGRFGILHYVAYLLRPRARAVVAVCLFPSTGLQQRWYEKKTIEQVTPLLHLLHSQLRKLRVAMIFGLVWRRLQDTVFFLTVYICRADQWTPGGCARTRCTTHPFHSWWTKNFEDHHCKNFANCFRDWTFGDGRFCVQLCMESPCMWATSVAHLTNFSFEFFYEIFTEDACQHLIYHCAKSQKWPKAQIKAGRGVARGVLRVVCKAMWPWNGHTRAKPEPARGSGGMLPRKILKFLDQNNAFSSIFSVKLCRQSPADISALLCQASINY